MELEKKIKVVKLSGVNQLVLSENKINGNDIDYVGSYNNRTNAGNEELHKFLKEIEIIMSDKTVNGKYGIKGNDLIFTMPNISVRQGFIADNETLSDGNIHYAPANNDYTTRIVISGFDQIISDFKATNLYGMDYSDQQKLVELINKVNFMIQNKVKPEKPSVNRENKYDKVKTAIAVTAGAAVILGGFILAGHYDLEDLERRAELAKNNEPTTSTYDENLLRDDYESAEMKDAIISGEKYSLEYTDNSGGYLRR